MAFETDPNNASSQSGITQRLQPRALQALNTLRKDSQYQHRVYSSVLRKGCPIDYLMKKLFLLALMGPFCLTAQAQTVPSELLDMSIEDLLQLEIVSDEESGGTQSNRWQLAYTYQMAQFKDYRIGTDRYDALNFLWQPAQGPRGATDYLAVTPEITQEVHALSLSYALSSKTFVTGQIPWVKQDTDHIAVIPGWPVFTVHSEAVGDANLSVNHQFANNIDSAWSLQAGISLPTGSIEERAATPRGPNKVLPYTMQMGSGTWDFEGGVMYLNEQPQFHWGFDANITVRTGRNDRDYRLGNKADVNLWAYLTRWHSVQPGVKLALHSRGAITGADPSLPGADAAGRYPTAVVNPDNYGGDQIDAVFFLRLQPQASAWYLDARYTAPVYQNLNGPQVSLQSSFGLSMGYSF